MVHSPLSPEAPGKRDSLLTEKNWRILLAGLSGAVLLFTIYCLAGGITTIFMHLYYFPIILLAYHYQRTGVLLSALLGALYVAIVAFFTYPAMQEIAGAIVRFWVFVGISLVVAYLSSVLARQQISRQTLFDRAGGGILYINRQDLIITDANTHFLNMLGYARDELIGTSLSSICTSPDGEALTPETFSPTMPDEYREVRIRAEDGHEKSAIISVGELPDDQYVLIITDITGQIQLQNENQQLSVLQENIIANANVWLMVLNAKGKVLIWNKAAEEISGYPAEEVVGSASIWKQLYPGRDYRQSVTEEINEIIQADNYLRNFETTILSKNGEKKNIMWNTRTLSTATASGEKGFVAIGVDITALKKSELEFNAIFDQTFQLVGLLNPDGTILKFNQTALDYEGISEAEITGKYLWETPSLNHPPEEQKKIQDAILHAAQGKHIQFEMANQMAGGTIHSIDFSIKPMMDETGNVIFLIAEGWDITRLKETEAALRESETKFRQIFDKANDGIEIVELRDDGLPGNYIDVNEVACRMLQYTREEMLRMTPLDISTDYFSRPFDSIIKEVQTLGKATFETEHRRKDGSIVPVEASMLAMILFEKRVILSIVRDITDRKRAERELQKLASIVQHSGELIALSTPDGTLIFMNEAGARMLGTTPEEAISHPILYFIPEHLKEKVESEILPLWIEQDSWEGDLQYINNSTGKLFDVHTLVFKIKDPATGEVLNLVNVSQDNTNRKRAEKALQEVNKKLNLLSSITRHDIINQVTAAEMFVEIMEMEGEIPPDSNIAEDLDKVATALKTIERQIVFTRDYQDLGVSSPNWQTVGRIIDETAPTISNGPAVKNEVGTLEIYADPLFEKVIYNLCDNAARHGEKITKIRFFSEESPEGFKLICEDDGVGVPADAKDKIFNRQYFKHTGLGLFLSKEILSITGMTIAETGVPGEGARFEILVPEGMWRVE